MRSLGGRSRYPRGECAARQEGSRMTWMVGCPVSAKMHSSEFILARISQAV